MREVEIMQGDAYPLEICIHAGGDRFPADALGEIEVVLGPIRKTLGSSELSYDETCGVVSVPLTQTETFSLGVGAHAVQIRVKSTNGETMGDDVGRIVVRASKSKEVL